VNREANLTGMCCIVFEVGSYLQHPFVGQRFVFIVLKPLFFEDTDISPRVSFHIKEEQTRTVNCRKKEMDNVHIPHISLHGPTNNDPDAADDWSQYVQSIFEWVGMACLGAQR